MLKKIMCFFRPLDKPSGSVGRYLPLQGENPKDPAVLKILSHSKFTMRSKLT